MKILPGSRIVGESGKALIVDRVEGEIIISGDRKIKLSAVLGVEPPPEPPKIKIGDLLRRNVHPQISYPSKWFLNETDNRPRTVPPIESATVERFSPGGYWVRTAAGALYHVPESAIDDGTDVPRTTLRSPTSQTSARTSSGKTVAGQSNVKHWELVHKYDQNN